MPAFPSFRTYTATSVLRRHIAGRREPVVVGRGRGPLDNTWRVHLSGEAWCAAAAIGGGAHHVASRHRTEGVHLVSIETSVEIDIVGHCAAPNHRGPRGLDRRTETRDRSSRSGPEH